MNRQQLLKHARENGYTGKAVLADVLKFLEDNGLAVDGEVRVSVKGSEGERVLKVAEVWAKTAAAITIEDEAEATDDDEESPREEAERKKKDADRLKRARNPRLAGAEADADKTKDGETKTIQAKAWRGIANRKAYDQKASRGEAVFDCSDIAEVVTAHTRLTMAGVMGGAPYGQESEDREICQKAGVEYDNTLGGSLVPDEFSTHVSRVMPRQGGMGSQVRNVPMSGDVQTFNRRTGGTTVYAVGEGVSITASTPTKTNVTLTTKKLGQIVQISSELMHDAAINVADDMQMEINYGFRAAEDNLIINGDATSTYWGYTGFRTAFLNLSATRANIAGFLVGAGNTFASLTLVNFTDTMGLLPDLEQAAEAKWYVNRRFYFNTMVRLAQAAGGVTSIELESGMRQNMFEGSPVVFVNAMPRVATADTVVALYGDASLAATLGQNGGVQIVASEHRYFDQDLTAFRGTKRVAFSAHDIGNASATESLRTPGPLVALALST